MADDSKPWLDETDLTAPYRRLLLTGRQLAPPPRAFEQAWLRFLAINGICCEQPPSGLYLVGGVDTALNR